jgi:uncharacterized protein (TIGR03435 family)
MEVLAKVLSMNVGRPVVDRTNLKATYAFQLDWSSDSGAGGKNPLTEAKADAAGETLPDPSGISIFTAVQEQLGLRLEATKGPVETIVVERVERPSGN